MEPDEEETCVVKSFDSHERVVLILILIIELFVYAYGQAFSLHICLLIGSCAAAVILRDRLLFIVQVLIFLYITFEARVRVLEAELEINNLVCLKNDCSNSFFSKLAEVFNNKAFCYNHLYGTLLIPIGLQCIMFLCSKTLQDIFFSLGVCFQVLIRSSSYLLLTLIYCTFLGFVTAVLLFSSYLAFIYFDGPSQIINLMKDLDTSHIFEITAQNSENIFNSDLLGYLYDSCLTTGTNLKGVYF